MAVLETLVGPRWTVSFLLEAVTDADDGGVTGRSVGVTRQLALAFTLAIAGA
jgi:hypothetical protein